MGEIKSTLDLIMERTKHLTLTDDEKIELKLKDISGKVKGLVGKYLEGFLRLDKFEDELEKMPEEDRNIAVKLIKEEAGELIGKGAAGTSNNNDAILRLVGELTDTDMDLLNKILENFNKEVAEAQTKYSIKLNEKMMSRGISGSAIIPNLMADKEWLEELSRLQDRFQEDIKAFM